MALNEHKRATDVLHLVQDKNVEVTDLLYIPFVDTFEDLSVGASDPGKPGAIGAYIDAAVVKLATYNGDGTWSRVGADSKSLLLVSSDTIIQWQTDIAPDESGNPSGQTYAQRFGNAPNIQIWMDTGSGYSLETVPVMMTFSGTNIDTITIQVGSINSRVIIK